MTSPGTAHAFSSKQTYRPAAPAPLPRHATLAERIREIARTPDVARGSPALLAGHLATEELRVRWPDQAMLESGKPCRIDGGWIVPVDAPAMIMIIESDPDARTVLSWTQGKDHECLVIFDRAYRCAHVDALQPASARAGKIHMLDHTKFDVRSTIDIPASGKTFEDHSRVVRAENLLEFQAMVLRGTHMGVASIHLTP